MKRLKHLLFSALVCVTACASARSDTTTTNAGLVKPTIGSPHWGERVNNNFDIIDSSFALLSFTNTFTASQHFNSPLRLYSTGIGFYDSTQTKQATIQNLTSNSIALIVGAQDGFYVNGNITSPPIPADIIAGGLSGSTPYGRFAVVGSSQDTSTAYSGFTATSPIDSSTLWSLPKKDGLSNQPLVTNGSTNLSFLNLSANQCVQTDASGGLSTSGAACGSGSSGGGASFLQTTLSGVQVTSPTSSLNFFSSDLSVRGSGTTSFISLNPSTTDFIHNQATAQTATLNVTSGSFNTQLTVPYVGSTQLLFNNGGGAVAGDASMTFDTANKRLGLNAGTNGDIYPLQVGSTSGSGSMLRMGYCTTGLCSFGGAHAWISATSSVLGLSASSNKSADELSISNAGGSFTDSLAVSGRTIIGYPSLASHLNTLDVANNFGNGAMSLGYAFSSQPTAPSNGLRVAGAAIIEGSMTVTNSQGIYSNYEASFGSATLRNVASGTQCLQADSSGHVTGTGAACGSGSGGAGGYLLEPATVTVALSVGMTASTGTFGSATSTALGNNPWVTMNSSGTSQALTINVNGIPSGGYQNKKGAVNIFSLGAGSERPATDLVIYDSTTDTQNGTGLLELWEDNANHNDPLIWIHDVGHNSSPGWRYDGAAPNMELINTSTDNAHGLGKWEPFAVAYQGVDLQINNRAYDNSTFETLAYWHPLHLAASGDTTMPGLYLNPQNSSQDGTVITSSGTSSINFFTLNAHTVGLTAAPNTTASWYNALPDSTGSSGNLMYHGGTVASGGYTVRQWKWASDANYSATTGFSVSTFTATSSATVKGLTVNGSGDGEVILTIFGSTYTVTSSSALPTVGHYAKFSSTWGTLMDGGTGSGGGGVGDAVVAGTQTWTGGNVYQGYTNLVGSTTLTASTITASGTFWDLTNSTITVSSFTVLSGNGTFESWVSGTFHKAAQLNFKNTNDNSTSNIVNNGGSGQAQMQFTATGGVGINNTPSSSFDLTLSSESVTSIFALPSRTKAQLGALTPGSTSYYYNCSDCTTVTTCVSTGTVVGAFSLITNKSSACQ